MAALSPAPDPLADAAVACLLDQGPPAGDLLRRLEDLGTAGAPAARAFLAAVGRRLPPDQAARVARGRVLVSRNPWLGGVVESLGCTMALCRVPGLLEAFPDPGHRATPAAAPGVALLHLATEAEALVPGTLPWRALVGVRLHQALLRATAPDADPFGGAPPLEPLALPWAIACWSHGLRAGLARLGVPVALDLAEAHHALWQAIGALLGVPARDLAPSAQAAPVHLHRLRAALPPAAFADRFRAARQLQAIAALPPCFACGQGLRALSGRVLGPELAADLGLADTTGWHRAWVLALRSNQLAAPHPVEDPRRIAS